MYIVRRVCLKVMVCSLLAALLPHDVWAQAGAEDAPRDTLRLDMGNGELPYVPSVNTPKIVAPDLMELVKATPDLPSQQRFSVPEVPEPTPRFSLDAMPVIPYYTHPSPLYRGDYSTGGVMTRLGKGYLMGAGSQTSLPGIGRLNEASIGYGRKLSDRLDFQIQMNAMKMTMSHLSRQMFNTSGMLKYQVSDRLAFRAFGSYVMGNSYGMGTNSYGATMVIDMTDRFGMEVGVQRYYDSVIDMTDRFGMEVGVQRYYDSMRGGWQTVPVAIPYYKFDKFTLGLDVGGILYEILRTAVFDSKSRSEGPTILPPRPSLPMR